MTQQAINPKLAMTDPENLRRLRWACRRGMWELDLVLQQFLDTCFRDLSSELQQDFIALLGEADQDLFRYLVLQQDPANNDLHAIITCIRQQALASTHAAD